MGKFKIKNPFKKTKKDPRTSVGPLRAIKQDLYPEQYLAKSKPFGAPSNKQVKTKMVKEQTKEYKKLRKEKDKVNKQFFGRFKEKKTLGDKLKDAGKTIMGKISLHKYKKGTMMAA